MSIDNTLEPHKVSSLLDTFSRELYVAKKHENPRTAQLALFELSSHVAGATKEAKDLFNSGREDSLSGYFPQSANLVYSVGFHAGAIEQKYSL